MNRSFDTPISNLARHFSARAGVRCSQITMDTAVIHRDAFIKTTPPGEQYSCGDNAPRFSGIRGYGFTGLRAGRKFGGGADGSTFTRALLGTASGGHFMSVSGVCSRRVNSVGHGSRYQARPVEHFFSLAPSVAQNFNAQGVDGFHGVAP